MAPPRCAKWAILSPLKLATPPKRSMAAIPITAHFALIGTGMNMIYNSVFGNKYAKATKRPMIAPDAPTAVASAPNRPLILGSFWSAWMM